MFCEQEQNLITSLYYAASNISANHQCYCMTRSMKSITSKETQKKTKLKPKIEVSQKNEVPVRVFVNILVC